ncbi:hypothetical protein GS597_19120 [Synechococcales cyanobacterium C]|uniref:Uncharacterized protein n=1 Tax=Petrachloros mirabilis ULC683 TaxID=2781853 RepID=A0A8K2A2B0_9CYAN|nr:hypothetical protein [Petrachloros mirabilis]NCJ08581.1 hypothetical protein [Petrachloros mirabilis ULC683]
METNNPMELLRKGFHVTLGATTSLVESVQDPQKREENLAELQLGFDELTQLWAAKGEVTELEGRQMLDNLMAQQQSTSADSTAYGVTGTTATTALLQEQLKELTVQLAAIRQEIIQGGE